MDRQVMYQLSVIFAAALMAALGAFALRRRPDRLATSMAAVCATALAWLLIIGAMAVTPPPVARALLSVKYLAIGASPVALFVFIMTWIGRAEWSRRSRITLLLVIPLVAQFASWQDGGEMLRRVSFSQAYGLTYIDHIEFGAIYWLFTFYSYGLTLAALIACLTYAWEAGGAVRRQGVLIACAVLAPVMSNMLLLSRVAPPQYDPMVLGIALNGVMLWWAVYRYQLFDLAPIARTVLVDTLEDGILIVDATNRVIDVNRAFAALADVSASDVVGRALSSLPLRNDTLAQAIHSVTAIASADGRASSLNVAGRVFDLTTVPIDGGAGRAQGRILHFHDATARHEWEVEQARLIHELQAALSEVRTLTGLLPICAGCKQIRDGGGEWQQLEVYIRDRTDADFTHSICPSCMARLYPDL